MNSANGKKIIFFDGTLENGGAEKVISILTDYLAQKDLPVEIITYYDSEIFYKFNDKIVIHSIIKNTKSKNILKNILWLRKYIKNNAGVVVSFLAPFNMIAITAKLGLKVPIIVADRSDPNVSPSNKIIRTARNFSYRFADLVVLQTKKNQEYFNKYLKHSCVINNPINLQQNAGLSLRKEHSKTIVSVGRLMPSKNHAMLIRAFNKFYQNHSDYNLIIYGEGPEREKTTELICELGLSEVVYLPGSIKDVNEKMSDAELFVLPSNYEGMSNALIEAMCLGMPVISTKVSGACELIENNENGILIDCYDENGLLEAMEKMITDDEFRNKCAQNATKLNDKLNVAKITSEWIDAMSSVSSLLSK